MCIITTVVRKNETVRFHLRKSIKRSITMKILLLTDRMDGGDVAKHVLQLAIRLRQRGEEVTVASDGGNLIRLLTQNGIAHRQFPFCTRSLSRLLRLRRQLGKWCRQEQFDVLHAHARIPAELMRGLVKKGGLETVTVHEARTPHGPKRLFSYFGMHTVTVSEALRASTAEAFGIPYERITVIPNGVDTAVFAPSDSVARTAQQAKRVRRLLAERFDAEQMTSETLALYRQYQASPCSPTLTLDGRFGRGDMGADGILQGLVGELRKKGFSAHLTVLSDGPFRTRRQSGVHCVHRLQLFSVICAFARSDAVLCTGTSLSQSTYGNRFSMYDILLLRLASRFSSAVLLLSADIGPSKGALTTSIVASTLQRIPYIGLRGQSSFDYADALGIDRNRLHLTEDLSFLLPPPPSSRTLFLLQKNGLNRKSAYLCVFLRADGTRQNGTARLLATALRIFCKQYKATPLLLEAEPLRDCRLTETVQAMLGGKRVPLGEPSDAVALMRRSLFAVSMHPHGLLFATMAHTPCIGIPLPATEKAMQEFAKKTGQEYIPPGQLNVVALVEKMERLLKNRRQFCATLPSCAEELRKKAEKDLENAMEVIYNRTEKQQQQKGNPI